MVNLEKEEMALLWVIVENGQAKRITKVARQTETPIGTYMYGLGSVREKMWSFLGLDNVRREIALVVNSSNHIQTLFQALDDEFQFNRKHTGIEFIVPLTRVMGTVLSDQRALGSEMNGEDYMYQAMMVIVDRGLANTVLEVAKEAGASGGTIMHGRGTGSTKAKKVFNMEIEPEKEAVLIISSTADSVKISDRINDEMNFEQPNTGILFTFPISDVKGFSHD